MHYSSINGNDTQSRYGPQQLQSLQAVTRCRRTEQHLIKQNQGVRRGLLKDATHPPDVPAEGGQALLQVLAVPNICKHLVKECQPGLLLLLLLY